MNLKMAARCSISTLAICAIFSAAAAFSQAATTVYLDRPSWEAAVAGSFLTEDFNGLTDPLALGLNDAGLIDIRVNGAVGLMMFTGSQFIGETDAPGGQTHDYVFPSPVRGFAADWNGTTGNSLLVTMLGGDTVLFADYLTPPGTGFLGFVSDVPFTEAHMTDQGLQGNELYFVDNLSFAPIPEPSGITLAGLGILGLFAIKRRHP
jgi:PEP-CTERM motif